MKIKLFNITAKVRSGLQKLKGIMHPLIFCTIIIALYLVYPTDYSIWNQMKLKRKIQVLEKERKKLVEEIDRNRLSLEKLGTDKVMLEKYAREKYLMKANDEDIYIIEERK